MKPVNVARVHVYTLLPPSPDRKILLITFNCLKCCQHSSLSERNDRKIGLNYFITRYNLNMIFKVCAVC